MAEKHHLDKTMLEMQFKYDRIQEENLTLRTQVYNLEHDLL